MSEATGGRTGYHHGDLRNALADAATDLAREGGPEAVVLRKAARRVGVSPTAAYRHFANQPDLLYAVKMRGQRRLAAVMARFIEEEGADCTPRTRLFALGHGYVRFAIEEPGLYRTAFCRIPPVRGWQETVEATVAGTAPDAGEFSSFTLLVDMLDGIEADGALRPGVRAGAEFAAWSAVHGLAMLVLDGPLAGLPEQVRDAVIARTLTLTVDGLVA